MSFDLDAVVGKIRTIKYNGRDVEIKNLNMEKYLLSEFKANNIDTLASDTKLSPEEIIAAMANQMKEYLMLILDVTEEEAEAMEYRQFRHLREYLSELDLLDQGFTPKEIERMKAVAAKNRVEQTLTGFKE